jgi:hypothetical protein
MHLTIGGILAWTAINALATLALVAVTVWLTVTGRRRDEQRRAEDRQHDSLRRAEDRQHDEQRRAEDRQRDEQLRAEDRQRDDRLRQEAREETQRRADAEQTAREDRDARQVIVRTERKDLGSTHLITVSTPHTYPIKQLQGQIARQTNNGMSLTGFSHGGNPPEVDHQRTYYSFRVDLHDRESPIIRFVDWRGNLYYQYNHYTERFPQNTDFPQAITTLDLWHRTGPKPDPDAHRK